MMIWGKNMMVHCMRVHCLFLFGMYGHSSIYNVLYVCRQVAFSKITYFGCPSQGEGVNDFSASPGLSSQDFLGSGLPSCVLYKGEGPGSPETRNWICC